MCSFINMGVKNYETVVLIITVKVIEFIGVKEVVRLRFINIIIEGDNKCI